MSELIKVELPDGQTVWAHVEPDGPRDVGFGTRAMKLHGFTEALQAVATNVRDAVRAARPNEVSVEFGIELSVGEEGLVAALAGVSGTTTLNVTMTWTAEAETRTSSNSTATS